MNEDRHAGRNRHAVRYSATMVVLVLLLLLPSSRPASGQTTMNRTSDESRIAQMILDSSLASGQAFAMLAELTGSVGARLSGSPQAARAVEWGRRTMAAYGLDRVRLQPVTVPHWVRGKVADVRIVEPALGAAAPIRACALGGSVATPKGGITAPVIEVRAIADVARLGERARGAIIFFNRPMNRTLANTFEAYGAAVDQRVGGAAAAGQVGAVAVLVRSMTTSLDTFPHTGTMHYAEGGARIPAAAISTVDAERLSSLLAGGKQVRVHIQLDCETLPDAESANVLGEITGSEHPEEVIVIGGHLDSWDIGQGAHDDGAGCVQAIEALRLLKQLGLRPKRTIRAVLFMNEENGLRGATAYAAELGTDTTERHVAAIESDRGGFAPRGFNVDGTPADLRRLEGWAPLFAAMGADRFWQGGSGADVDPLKKHGALTIGLIPESHRYFDYHHSAKDVLEAVNERELQLGAGAMALLAWLLSEN